tara:strand:- start:5215 stop:5391 length:177 start_codon:yes stop_codon:yes gene_type:complete
MKPIDELSTDEYVEIHEDKIELVMPHYIREFKPYVPSQAHKDNEDRAINSRLDRIKAK